jgi:hypothetical protein
MISAEAKNRDIDCSQICICRKPEDSPDGSTMCGDCINLKSQRQFLKKKRKHKNEE